MTQTSTENCEWLGLWCHLYTNVRFGT